MSAQMHSFPLILEIGFHKAGTILNASQRQPTGFLSCGGCSLEQAIMTQQWVLEEQQAGAVTRSLVTDGDAEGAVGAVLLGVCVYVLGEGGQAARAASTQRRA